MVSIFLSLKVRNYKGRKFAPDEGNRYDGIYKVEWVWPESCCDSQYDGFTGGEVLACQGQCRICCVEVLAEKGRPCMCVVY